MRNEEHAFLLRFKNGRYSELTLYSDFYVKSDYGSLVMLSVIGDDSTVKAFTANVYSASHESKLDIAVHGIDSNFTDNITVSYDKYKVFTSPIGEMTHSLYVKRELLERDFEDERMSEYIVATDGNVLNAFKNYMKTRVTTPFLDEWAEPVFAHLTSKSAKSHTSISLCKPHGLSPIRVLNVPSPKRWDDLMRDIVRAGVIVLPTTEHNANITKETKLNDYIQQNARTFAEKVNAAYTPRVAADEPLSPLIDNLKRKPFPAQAVVIEGISRTLNDRSSAVVVGEMGTGKTLIGASIPYIHANNKPYRALVMAPGHLVNKWQREIEQTIPNTKAVIIDDWRHLVELHSRMMRKPCGIEYYIISRDRAKLGHFTRHGAVWNERKKMWLCPDCGNVITFTEKEDSWLYGKRDVKVPAPRDFFDKPKRSNTVCPSCKVPLWQADNSRVRRYAPADYIKRHMRGYFDYFIADEVHELKGTTAQGNVLGAIASVARKTIALTGTLLGGYAADLFYLLYRLNPTRVKVVEQLEYAEQSKWEKRYGSVERITRTYDEDFNVSSRGSTKKQQVKRIPGVSPLVFTRHLLDSCAFVELADIESELPPYDEIVVGVDMDADQKAAYRSLADILGQQIRQYGSGNRFLGLYLSNLLSYPDQPYLRREIVDPADGAHITFTQALDIDRIYPKEQEMIDIVSRELSAGRRVFVYAVFTGERLVQNRIERIISDNVPNAKIAILDTKIKPQDREDWIAKQVKVGANVIIGNPKLVETGIDLTGETNFPTLVFYQTGYSLFTLRQASRRSWRIGQTEDVRVYFLAYKDTLQYAALQLMGAKLEAALSLEGKFSDEGLRAMAGGLDVTALLAKAITRNLDDIDSAETIFARLNSGRTRSVKGGGINR